MNIKEELLLKIDDFKLIIEKLNNDNQDNINYDRLKKIKEKLEKDLEEEKTNNCIFTKKIKDLEEENNYLKNQIVKKEYEISNLKEINLNKNDNKVSITIEKKSVELNIMDSIKEKINLYINDKKESSKLINELENKINENELKKFYKVFGESKKEIFIYNLKQILGFEN